MEFWFSPAKLELELRKRPGVPVNPVMRETNTTDPSLLLTREQRGAIQVILLPSPDSRHQY